MHMRVYHITFVISILLYFKVLITSTYFQILAGIEAELSPSKGLLLLHTGLIGVLHLPIALFEVSIGIILELIFLAHVFLFIKPTVIFDLTDPGLKVNIVLKSLMNFLVFQANVFVFVNCTWPALRLLKIGLTTIR